MSAPQIEKVEEKQTEKISWTGYVSLILVLIFFSGIFRNATGPLAALDFTNVTGAFGKLGTLAEGAGVIANDFRGTGGTGPKEGFLFALTIFPQIMFALGVLKVVENLDGFKAAEKLLSPIVKPIFGLPGASAISIVASLNSTDAGASLIKELKETGKLNAKEELIITAFQFASPGALVNFFALAGPLLGYLEIPAVIPLAVILFCKILSANLMRIFSGRIVKEDAA